MSDQPVHRITISDNLFGQDDNLDILFNIYEQLQLATVEASHPGLDLLTFAESVLYFGVIMLHGTRKFKPLKDEEFSPPQLPNDPLRTEWREIADNHPRGSPPTIPRFKSSTPDEALGYEVEDSESRASVPPSPSPSAPSEPSGDLTYQFEDEGDGRDTWMSPSLPLPNPSQVAPGPWDDYKETPEIGHWSLPPPPTPLQYEKPIGIVYLAAFPPYEGEFNVGITLLPEERGKGYARQALNIVIIKAFKKMKCHRLQAALLEHAAKERALCLFTEMGFNHEGTRRRSFLSPIEREWKDVTYMAMLDTDWVMSQGRTPTIRAAPKSLWDELFARHQREREELLHWEATKTSIRRTSSMVTLRASTPTPSTYTSTSESDGEMETDETSNPFSSSLDKGKRKAVALDYQEPGYAASTSPLAVDSIEEKLDLTYKRLKSTFSLNRFEADQGSESEPDSESTDGYNSSTSWDVLDSSSIADSSDSGESSRFEHIGDSP